MNILLIIIISGFVLLSLGSPDKVATIKNNIASLVHQVSEATPQSTGDASAKDADVTHNEQLDEHTRKNQPSGDHTTASDETNETADSMSTPDFSNVGDQQDIPASAVLADAPTSDFSLAKSPEQVADSQPDPLVHKDRHTLVEIHAQNADALEILDRIAKNYQ